MKSFYKYIILFVLCSILFHCALENKSSKSKDIEVFEKDADGIDDVYDSESDEMIVTEELEEVDDEYKFEYTTFNKDQALISQKLQDFYDLLALQNKHPEFKEDVELQLKNYTKDSLNIYSGKEVFLIDDITLISPPKQMDPNTIKVEIEFSLKSNFKTSRERLFAYITKKETIIDGESYISNKVMFSKN